MNGAKAELKVFVASPADLTDERDAVDEIASRLNANVGDLLDVTITVRRYEQLVGRAGAPQDQINPWVDDCDVLIAIVNRRWGSPTGNNYDSGFAEEFDRARKRWERTGRPVIALFFKQIDQPSLDDPGPQLARVLAFRKDIEEKHHAFYSNFATTDAFRLRVQQLLIEEMHRRGRIGTTGEGYSPTRSAARREEQVSQSTAATGVELSTVLRHFVDVMTGVPADGPLDFDRLELFALSASRDDEQIPIHLANRVFLRHNGLQFMQVEADAWFKTYVSDIGRARQASERVVPFPSAFGGRDAVERMCRANAVDLLRSDTADVRMGFLCLASALSIRPASLWPRDRPEEPELTAYHDLWIPTSDTSTLAAGVVYWLSVGGSRDLRLAKVLATSTHDSEARFGAILVGLLKKKPDAGPLAESLPDLLLNETIRALFAEGNSLGSLEVGFLEKMVLRTFGNSKLRLAALEELVRRDQVPNTVIIEAIHEEQSESILETYWYEQARRCLFDRPCSPGFISRAIDAIGQLGDKSVARRVIVRLAADNPPLREAASDILSWSPTSETFTEDKAALILRASEGTEAHVDMAKQLVVGIYPPATAFVEGLRESGATGSVLAFVESRFKLHGLRYLTHLPAKQIERSVVAIVREESKSKGTLWFESRALLRRVCTDQDVEFLLGNLRYGANEERLVWIETILRRATLKRLNALLASELHDVPTLALGELGRRERLPSRRRIYTLLRSPDADLRMAAVEFLCEGLDADGLSLLLNRYVGASGPFYYNVVCEIDRRLAGVPLLHPVARG